MQELALSELDLTQNFLITSLVVSFTNLSTVNIGSLPDLNFLHLGGASLEEIDLSQNTLLSFLGIESTSIVDLELSQNTNLLFLSLYETTLNSLDLTNNPQLNFLEFLDGTELLSGIIDLSSNQLLADLLILNSKISTVIAKNGNEGIVVLVEDSLEEVNYICVEDEAVSRLEQINLEEAGHVQFSSFCFFDPGGEVYSANGRIFFGSDCDLELERAIRLQVTDGIDSFTFYSDSRTGDYNLVLPPGTYQIETALENQELFRIEPEVVQVELSSAMDSITNDFCLIPKDEVVDLSAHLWLDDVARPGFEVQYTLKLRNTGTADRAGRAELFYDNDRLTYIDSPLTPISIEPGKLTWDIDDLLIFEDLNIPFVMRLNSPMDNPPLNGGEELCFTAQVLPLNDFRPTDNITSLKHSVVNAFDPNDKTCLEGSTILPEKAGDFLHYRIRFENTGTAEAVNIVVTDTIDRTTLDITTLDIIESSHPMRVRSEGDLVQFHFEEIFLPFDDENNDGFIIFRIRTQPDLEVGDLVENKVDIFFDFNFPIVTNIASTLIEVPTSTEEIEDEVSSVLVYPNPARDDLHINSEQLISSVSLFNASGKESGKWIVPNQKTTKLQVDHLSPGIYMMEVMTSEGSQVKKIIID